MTASNLVSLTVFDHTLSFRADADFAMHLRDLAEEAERRAILARAENRNDPHSTAAFLIRAVDTLLGTGTVDRLFPEQSPDVFDLCEILCEVTNAFHAYRQRRMSRLFYG